MEVGVPALPAGWTTFRRGAVPLYLHLASRAVLATPPRTLPGSSRELTAVSDVSPGEAALVAALNAAARQSLGPANAQPVSGLHQCGLTASVPAVLPPHLMARPPQPNASAPCTQLTRGVESPAETAIRFLRAYVWETLGVVVEMRARPSGAAGAAGAAAVATEAAGEAGAEAEAAGGAVGSWFAAECHVDGLLLGRAVHHTAHLACGVAAEDALLLLCPLKWEAAAAGLRAAGGCRRRLLRAPLCE